MMMQACKSAVACLVGASILCAASTASAQEVAEIPFISAPPGSAALGGGLRFGQSPYFAMAKAAVNTEFCLEIKNSSPVIRCLDLLVVMAQAMVPLTLVPGWMISLLN